MPFSRRRGGSQMMMRYKQSAAQYLQQLGAILLFDGTLTDDMTPKIANLGSAGSALDGVPTAVTIDENGMNFDGDTSMIVVPLTAALSALTDQEALVIGNPASGGEGGVGSFFRFGLNPLRLAYISSGASILGGVDYNTTDATTIIVSPGTGLRGFFLAHDASAKVSRIRLAASGTVSNPTQTPVTGVTNLVAPTSDLVIGNHSAGTAGWDGYMSLFAYMGRMFTTQERSNIAAFFE